MYSLTEKRLLNSGKMLYVTFMIKFVTKFNFVTEQVLPLSQFLLLQTAAPDAVVRLQNTALEEQKAIEEMYFKKLHHHSIEEFLTDQLQQCEGKGGLLIQVTIIICLKQYDVREDFFFSGHNSQSSFGL